MIKENVKNLFEFIDYLHSNITYLLSKQNLINKTNELLEKRNSIRPNENYKSKIEYDKLQIQIAEQFDIVDAEIIFPLKEKIRELNIADISTPIINLTAQSDLFELQRNFNEDDLHSIFEAKQKYLNFRNETNFDFYLQFFFFELDRTLNEFYEFFKDGDFNEFSKLQTNIVTIESLDRQGIEKAVRKLTGNSNNLHFETFPEFLNYFKTNFNDLEIDERHNEAKRLFEQQKLKLENSTFQSEIDEVKELSENAVKDFKHKLMLSFTNKNYKTRYNEGLNPVIAISKLYFEYENLYNSAKNKSDIFSHSSDLNKKEKILFSDVKSLPFQQIKETIGYFSIPENFDVNDDWVTQKRKCEMHNQSIYRNYEENLSNGKKRISDLVSKMLLATNESKQISYYDLLERQFNQIKSIFSVALNSEIDKGCEIEAIVNLSIENKFKEMREFHKKSLIDIDVHLKTLDGFRKRDIANESLTNLKFEQPKQNNKTENNLYVIKTDRKYIAKENALAYIFDLYAKGEMIPINVIDGGYNAKELKRIGLIRGFSRPDTFYRAVISVLKFDLNKVKDLQAISKDWLNVVEKLSDNWMKTQQYLIKQNLIEE
ncbi:hypothetical protein HZQ64_09080 [Elizabethkingia anophelis]|nr:hypothetical protein [Elizabethkingia anophelis]MCT3783965.1 hypothetical protein [Elizabethkingia anophelis]MCT3791511.1 hypothetical protein [Elizabethkingia anophelis]MCT3794741.1 hypothetical protein [Elizabethkingia anophelis]MCT3798597.1 hypothetical protein [Elizabethkingia anophelis]